VTGYQVTTEQAAAVIVVGALVFLFLIHRGFSGIVVSIGE
jgi:hypothetical protein